MTKRLCRELLDVPHESLTETCCNMLGSDRCRTKGAAVYCYVLPLLPSLHPSFLCLPLWDTGPLLLQSDRRCVADLNVISEEKEGGWIYGD